MKAKTLIDLHARTNWIGTPDFHALLYETFDTREPDPEVIAPDSYLVTTTWGQEALLLLGLQPAALFHPSLQRLAFEWASRTRMKIWQVELAASAFYGVGNYTPYGAVADVTPDPQLSLGIQVKRSRLPEDADVDAFKTWCAILLNRQWSNAAVFVVVSNDGINLNKAFNMPDVDYEMLDYIVDTAVGDSVWRLL